MIDMELSLNIAESYLEQLYKARDEGRTAIPCSFCDCQRCLLQVCDHGVRVDQRISYIEKWIKENKIEQLEFEF